MIRDLLWDISPYENFDYHRWGDASTTGWHGDSAYFGKLVEEARPKCIIEVGSWLGESAINMARAVKLLGLACEIVCVDTWLGPVEFYIDRHTMPDPYNTLSFVNGYPWLYYQFLANVCYAGLQDIITPFPMTSVGAAKFFWHHKVEADLIYIDGDHERKAVIDDLRLYHALLKDESSIIFGDDYDADGINAAVKWFARARGVDMTIEENENTFWRLRHGSSEAD